MNAKLKTALFISPVIALYGQSPFYLTIKSVDTFNILFSFISLTIMVFLFWLGNIWLLSKARPPWQLYTISYLSTFLIHLMILLFIPKFPAENNNMFFFYPLVSTLAINSIILIILNAQQLKERKNSVEVELQKVKVENLEAQKKMLQQQLQPHFLFNALSTLKSLIKSNADMAVDYTLHLSEFLRYAQTATEHEKVSVRDELKFTRDYLLLQKIRYDNAFECTIHVPDEILTKKLPVFSIQLLLENALKHNRMSASKPLTITVFYANNGILVKNNKYSKPLIMKSGTGLKNLNNRYRLLFDDEIVIEEDQNTYQVKLPIK
jgi:LytS/YehU family sensor histidine kinase